MHDSTASQSKEARFQQLQAACEGRWEYIFSQLCPDLASAMEKRGRHVVCPVHGGKHGDAFRLFENYAVIGNGICNTCGAHREFGMVAWVNGWTLPVAIREVAKLVGMEYGQSPRAIVLPKKVEVTPPDKAELAKARANRQRYLKGLWEAAQPISASTSLFQRYLRSRGLPASLPGGFPPTLRLHPELVYREHKEARPEYFPAILAKLCHPTPDGRLLDHSLHRTYLATDGNGKAPVPKAKKCLLGLNGDKGNRGVVMPLARPARTMALTEGLENAWIIQAMTGIPTWASYSANNLPNIQFPGIVERVFIFGDRDESGAGQTYADLAQVAISAQGKQCLVVLPDTVGQDWVDLYNKNTILIPSAQSLLKQLSAA